MTEKELWKQYLSAHPEDRNKTYEAWCYGSDTPDELAALTASGIKTATASAYAFYAYEKCDLPKAGDFSIILRTDGTALCLIQTERVSVVPFMEVTAEQAYKEGEGDRSLAYWRTVHKKFFTEELAEIHQSFSEDMLVVCEEFRVIFPTGTPA